MLLGSVNCEVATFDGTTATKTVKEITLKPAYSKCTSVEREVTTHLNGCAYRVTFTTEASAEKWTLSAPGKK